MDIEFQKLISHTVTKWLSLYPSLPSVEFVLAPQHETSCDPETTTKEDFNYWRKITEESNLEVFRRIHDKSNKAED